MTEMSEVQYAVDNNNMGELTVLKVYELAADAGKECQRLIERFGPDSANTVTLKIISILEHLELLVNEKAELERRAGGLNEELTICRGKLDRKSEDYNLLQADLHILEDQHLEDLAEWKELLNKARKENKDLKRQLNEKEGQVIQEKVQEQETLKVLLRLKETVDKQRDEIRAKDSELRSRNQDVEALQQQVERLAKVNGNLRRKQEAMETHSRHLIRQKSHLQVDVMALNKDLLSRQSRSRRTVARRRETGAKRRENGARHLDAGTEHQEIGVGHQASGAMHQETMAGHQETETGDQETGGMHLEIGGEHREIGAGHQEIGAGHREIGAGHREIGAGHQEIGARHQETETGDQETGARHHDIGVSHQEIGAEHQEIGTQSMDQEQEALVENEAIQEMEEEEEEEEEEEREEEGRMFFDPKDPNRPRFTLEELRKVLIERDEMHLKVVALEEELEAYRSEEDQTDSPARPSGTSPNDHTKNKTSGIRKFFANLFKGNKDKTNVEDELAKWEFLDFDEKDCAFTESDVDGLPGSVAIGTSEGQGQCDSTLQKQRRHSSGTPVSQDRDRLALSYHAGGRRSEGWFASLRKSPSSGREMVEITDTPLGCAALQGAPASPLTRLRSASVQEIPPPRSTPPPLRAALSDSDGEGSEDDGKAQAAGDKKGTTGAKKGSLPLVAIDTSLLSIEDFMYSPF